LQAVLYLGKTHTVNQRISRQNFTLSRLSDLLYRYAPIGVIIHTYRYERDRLNGIDALKPLFSFVDSRIQSLQDFLDGSFDRIYGTDTSGVIKLKDLENKPKNVELATWYEATSTKIFEQIMSYLEINFGEFQFIDFGSGKGRVLLLAAQYGFEKVIGIEFSPELHQIAIDNIQILETQEKSI
jgi:hypothetical protein